LQNPTGETTVSKQIIAKDLTQFVQQGQKQTFQIVKGQQIRIQEILDAAAKDATNVVVTRNGANLTVKFVDGTEVDFVNFYTECAGGACSVTVGGADAAGFTIGTDTPVGAALADGGQLVYAYGEQNSLMAMATGDAGMTSAISGLGQGVVTYTGAASTAAVAGGFSGLGLVAAGLGLAAAGGGGWGGGVGGVVVVLFLCQHLLVC